MASPTPAWHPNWSPARRMSMKKENSRITQKELSKVLRLPKHTINGVFVLPKTGELVFNNVKVPIENLLPRDARSRRLACEQWLRQPHDPRERHEEVPQPVEDRGSEPAPVRSDRSRGSTGGWTWPCAGRPGGCPTRCGPDWGRCGPQCASAHAWWKRRPVTSPAGAQCRGRARPECDSAAVSAR